jgi:hypothetical protein
MLIVFIVEIMMKNNFSSQNPLFRDLQKFELLILILLDQTSAIEKRD